MQKFQETKHKIALVSKIKKNRHIRTWNMLLFHLNYDFSVKNYIWFKIALTFYHILTISWIVLVSKSIDNKIYSTNRTYFMYPICYNILNSYFQQIRFLNSFLFQFTFFVSLLSAKRFWGAEAYSTENFSSYWTTYDIWAAYFSDC